ncbi:MAG: DNA repair protein RadC [Caulobacteraceae bacterium]|nr:DNA repair protein RadC [Caulobacteraceae bacterium]
MDDAHLPHASDVAETASHQPFVSERDRAAGLSARLVALGPRGLTEAETLELILARCLPRGADPQSAAESLLARFGCIGRIVGADPVALAAVIGAGAAGELTAMHALLLRALEHPLARRCVLTSSQAVKAYLRLSLAAAPREAFHVLFLDKANQLIVDERMGIGTVDHAPVYPREVVRRALELSASAVVLAHNHPTGGSTPSAADIEMTRRVVEAARALDIAVHDHFLVAGDEVVSFRGLGLM